MKLSHFTLFTIVLISCFVNSHAQKIRFTDSTNYWRTLSRSPEFPPTKYHDYSISGSYILYGRKYSCLTENYGGSCTYVRDDTATGMVYYLDNTTGSKEYVLYNYNLNEGDTIRYIRPYGLPNTDSVVNIDTVIINGVEHKSFDLTNSSRGSNRYYTVIEGVGGTNAPFFHVRWTSCFEYSESLLCFQNRSITPEFEMKVSACSGWTMYPDINCGYSAVNTNENTRQIFIFPTPANKELNISIPEIKARQMEIKILGLDGRLMARKDMSNPKKTFQVDVSQLLEGVYILMVSDETGTMTRKPIVIGH